MFLNNLKIDIYLQNNEEIFEEKNINAKRKNNLLFFELNDKYELNINKNIILKKENKESILKFNFIENEKNIAEYYLKEFDSYINIKIKTNYIRNIDNEITINYDLYIEDDLVGNNTYKITIKE